MHNDPDAACDAFSSQAAFLNIQTGSAPYIWLFFVQST